MVNNNLTEKEKTYLEDAMSMENLIMTKLVVYADQCQDKELTDMMFRMAKSKRDHANTMKQMLQSGARNYH